MQEKCRCKVKLGEFPLASSSTFYMSRDPRHFRFGSFPSRVGEARGVRSKRNVLLRNITARKGKKATGLVAVNEAPE